MGVSQQQHTGTPVASGFPIESHDFGIKWVHRHHMKKHLQKCHLGC